MTLHKAAGWSLIALPIVVILGVPAIVWWPGGAIMSAVSVLGALAIHGCVWAGFELLERK